MFPLNYFNYSQRTTLLGVFLILCVVLASNPVYGTTTSEPDEVSAAASGRVFYVATTGDDKAAGSASAPWKTLRPSMEKLRPGDTLLVANGQYWEKDGIRPVLPSGRPDARITVKPWGKGVGDRVVLKARIHIVNANYWTFDGLNIDARPADNISNSPNNLAPSHALVLRGGKGWWFRNAEICCYPSYGNVAIDGDAKDWVFSHNFVWSNPVEDNSDRFHNIYLTTTKNSGPGFIERNVLAGAKNGTNIKVGHGSYNSTVGDPKNVTIQRNTMVGANWNVRLVYGTSGTVLERNLLTGADKPWPKYATAIQPYCVSGTHNYSSNNYFYGPLTRSVIDPVNRGLNCAGGNKGWLRESSKSVGPANPQLKVTPAQTYDGKFGRLPLSGFVPAEQLAKSYGRFSGFDQVVAADLDGDGKDTPLGVLRNRVYVTDSETDAAGYQFAEATSMFTFGKVGGKYVAADFNGDGKDEVAVFDPSTATFHVYGGSSVRFGSMKSNYAPVAADFNGDGKAEFGLFDLKTKTFHVRQTNGSVTSFAFGSVSRNYVPVAGDFDKDGKAEVGLWDKSSRTFHIRGCAAKTCVGSGSSVMLGSAKLANFYQPVVGDWGEGDSLGLVLNEQWLRVRNMDGSKTMLPVRSFDG